MTGFPVQYRMLDKAVTEPPVTAHTPADASPAMAAAGDSRYAAARYTARRSPCTP